MHGLPLLFGNMFYAFMWVFVCYSPLSHPNSYQTDILVPVYTDHGQTTPSILNLLISIHLLEPSSPSSRSSGSTPLLSSSFSVKCCFVLWICWDETLEPARFYRKLINLSVCRPAHLWLAVQQRDQKSILQQLEQDSEKKQQHKKEIHPILASPGRHWSSLHEPWTEEEVGEGKKWLERCRRSVETPPGVLPLVCPLVKDFVRRFLNDKTESEEVYLPGHTHRRVLRNNLEPECEDGSWKIGERGDGLMLKWVWCRIPLSAHLIKLPLPLLEGKTGRVETKVELKRTVGFKFVEPLNRRLLCDDFILDQRASAEEIIR